MPQTLTAVKHSLRLQRSTACLIWLLIVVKVAAVLWLELRPTLWLLWNVIKAIFSPRHWMYTLVLVSFQGPVVIAHSAVLLPLELEPLQLPSDVAKFKRTITQLALRWTPTSWLRTRQGASSNMPDSQGVKLLIKLLSMGCNLNLQHTIGRMASWRQSAKLVMLLMSCTFSALCTIWLFSYLKTHSPGHLNDVMFDGMLAFTFCSAVLARKQDILQYPDTSSAYLPHLISKLPSVCRQAAAVTSFAFFLKLLAYTLLSLTVGLPSVLSIRAGFVTQLLGGSFCAFCWSACVCLLQIVYTHRVKQFQEDSGGDPSALLIPALFHSQDPALQNAAFQDLCFLAEASGPAAWRRKMVFDKDNGEAWQKLSSACMDEALILSAAQPSELQAWRLHSHCQRIIWSMRTLAGFAVAASTEDKKGVLHNPSQPDCPDLATVIATLLSSLLVLQEFAQQVASSPLQMHKEGHTSSAAEAGGSHCSSSKADGDQHPVFRSASMLQAAAAAAVHKLVGVYGQDFAAVLNKIAYQPAHGSKEALQRLALQCIQSAKEQQK